MINKVFIPFKFSSKIHQSQDAYLRENAPNPKNQVRNYQKNTSLPDFGKCKKEIQKKYTRY